MSGKKVKILVIDDEPDVVVFLEKFLSLRGYEIVNAYSGEEALTILESESVDLVLLDIVMHGIDGAAVAKIINEKYPQVKILIVTAYPEAGNRIIKSARIEGLFIKPHGLEELYNEIIRLNPQA